MSRRYGAAGASSIPKWLLLALAVVVSFTLGNMLLGTSRHKETVTVVAHGPSSTSTTGGRRLQDPQQPVTSCSPCHCECAPCHCEKCPTSVTPSTGCRDATSLARAAKKVYGYESPITDIDTMAKHAPAFHQLPQEAFPPADTSMVEYWRKLQPYTSEFNYHGNNGMFGECDGAVLHAFIRQNKPRRVYEVGSGHSTHVAHKALEANAAEGHPQAEHLCVEPYRANVLRGLNIKVIERPIQEVDLAIFDELQAGDMLFLDNSHVIRPYSDVIFELLWILPRLKPGVFVHLHDILLPYDYIPRWMHRELRAYTEQYMLAAFLYGNSQWKVVFHNGHYNNTAGHLLEAMDDTDRASYLQRCSFNHEVQPTEATPASIYLQRVQ